VLNMMLLSMDLFVFLQILRTFEGLATDLAIMRLEWRMNCQANRNQPRLVRGDVREDVTSEVAGDVISLRASRTTILPSTSETEVIGALSANVVIAEVVVEDFGVCVGLSAVDPKTDQGGLLRGG
jgi:hypothetical protein